MWLVPSSSLSLPAYRNTVKGFAGFFFPLYAHPWDAPLVVLKNERKKFVIEKSLLGTGKSDYFLFLSRELLVGKKPSNCPSLRVIVRRRQASPRSELTRIRVCTSVALIMTTSSFFSHTPTTSPRPTISVNKTPITTTCLWITLTGKWTDRWTNMGTTEDLWRNVCNGSVSEYKTNGRMRHINFVINSVAQRGSKQRHLAVKYVFVMFVWMAKWNM